MTVGFEERAQAVYDHAVLANNPPSVVGANFDGHGSRLSRDLQLGGIGQKRSNEVSKVILHG